MGNRAVINFENMPSVGVYVHWNGGPESVLAFLHATRDRGARLPGYDKNYAFARLVGTITDFFEDNSTSVGVGPIESLDCDNYDNGLYTVGPDWELSSRTYCRDSVAVLNTDQLPADQFKRYQAIYDALMNPESAEATA